MIPSYIEYDFTYENVTDIPQCVIYGMILANSSLKSNKLIRHLETIHVQYKNKTKDFFKENKEFI